MKTTLRILARTALIAFVVVGQARAQVVPKVGFVHGFGSGPDTWDAMMGQLHDSLVFTPIAVRLSWWKSPLLQEQEMADRYGTDLGPRPYLIGHSAGGIVSREYGAISGSTGVLTVGSPHAGAPIASNIPFVADNAALMALDVYELVDAFVPVASYVTMFGDWMLQYLSDIGAGWLIAVVEGLPSWINGLLTQTPLFATENLQPSSEYIWALNSAPHLALEITNIDRAVSLAVETDPTFAVWRLLQGVENGNNLGATLDWAGVLMIGFGDQMMNRSFFEDGNSFQYNRRGFALWRVGGDLLSVDGMWCTAVGDPLCQQGSDGFIPKTSQMWGDVQQFRGQLTHTQETKDLTLEVQRVMRTKFNIPTR